MQKILSTSLLLAAAVPAFAQTTHPCAQVAAPAERLACYDKTFPPAPEVHEAQQRLIVDDFGKSTSDKPRADTVSAPLDRIQAQVVSVDYAGTEQIIHLDNGQIWRSADGARVATGEAISVRKGALGSFLLTTTYGVQLRVRRVR